MRGQLWIPPASLFSVIRTTGSVSSSGITVTTDNEDKSRCLCASGDSQEDVTGQRTVISTLTLEVRRSGMTRTLWLLGVAGVLALAISVGTAQDRAPVPPGNRTATEDGSAIETRIRDASAVPEPASPEATPRRFPRLNLLRYSRNRPSNQLTRQPGEGSTGAPEPANIPESILRQSARPDIRDSGAARGNSETHRQPEPPQPGTASSREPGPPATAAGSFRRPAAGNPIAQTSPANAKHAG